MRGLVSRARNNLIGSFKFFFQIYHSENKTTGHSLKKQVKRVSGPANLEGNMFVVDYDCMTAAGPTHEALLRALHSGEVCSSVIQANTWANHSVPAGGLVASIAFKNRSAFSRQELISTHLNKLWKNIFSKFSDDLKSQLAGQKVGLFFASTTGTIEDFVYSFYLFSYRDLINVFISDLIYNSRGTESIIIAVDLLAEF